MQINTPFIISTMLLLFVTILFYITYQMVTGMDDTEFNIVQDKTILVEIDPGLEKAVEAWLTANPLVGYSDLDELVRQAVRIFIAGEGGKKGKRKKTMLCKFYRALRARV